MSELGAVHECKECPLCAEQKRVGFLKFIFDADVRDAIPDKTIEYECQTCFTLFEVIR